MFVTRGCQSLVLCCADICMPCFLYLCSSGFSVFELPREVVKHRFLSPTFRPVTECTQVMVTGPARDLTLRTAVIWARLSFLTSGTACLQHFLELKLEALLLLKWMVLIWVCRFNPVFFIGSRIRIFVFWTRKWASCFPCIHLVTVEF